jgi:hypothetical protein
MISPTGVGDPDGGHEARTHHRFGLKSLPRAAEAHAGCFLCRKGPWLSHRLGFEDWRGCVTDTQIADGDVADTLQS